MARDAAQPFEHALRLCLARAGLAPPRFAMLIADVMANADAEAEEMPGLRALIDPILQEIGYDPPFEVHAALVELLAGLPPACRMEPARKA